MKESPTTAGWLKATITRTCEKGVETGEKYKKWKFSDEATGGYPYFIGDEKILLKAVGVDPFEAAEMEAASYSATFPDRGPKEFTCWLSENGFAMRTKWEGTTKDGGKMGFWPVGLIRTKEKGEVTHWEILVDDSDFGSFLKVALGVRRPFKGESGEYMAAVARALEAGGKLGKLFEDHLGDKVVMFLTHQMGNKWSKILKNFFYREITQLEDVKASEVTYACSENSLVSSFPRQN
jgi:hypothetical protein